MPPGLERWALGRSVTDMEVVMKEPANEANSEQVLGSEGFF